MAEGVAETSAQGVVYISSGSGWTESDVTAEKLYKLRGNVYARGISTKVRNLIFAEDPVIEIYDPENNVDEALQTHVTKMFEAPKVALAANMRIAFDDGFWYGASPFNPVWKYEGPEYRLVELSHLPAHTLDILPPGYKLYCNILQGIVLDDKKQIRYFQRNENGYVTAQDELDPRGVLLVCDRSTGELAGDPIVRPIVPILEMLAFTWNAEMQRVNRIGAPPLFIKITNPQPASDRNNNVSDMEYAEMILMHWGKDNQYPLRSNMEPIWPDIKDLGITTSVIDMLNWVLIDYMTPTSFVSKNTGAIIGGSTRPEASLLHAYIQGIHKWLEEGFNQLLQTYLEANNYKGYTGRIRIPTMAPDKTEVRVKQALVGAQTKVLHPNEVREYLDAEGISDEEIAKIMETWNAANPAPASPFGAPQAPPVNDTTTKGIAPDSTAEKPRSPVIEQMIQKELGDDLNLDRILEDLIYKVDERLKTLEP